MRHHKRMRATRVTGIRMTRTWQRAAGREMAAATLSTMRMPRCRQRSSWRTTSWQSAASRPRTRTWRIEGLEPEPEGSPPAGEAARKPAQLFPGDGVEASEGAAAGHPLEQRVIDLEATVHTLADHLLKGQHQVDRGMAVILQLQERCGKLEVRAAQSERDAESLRTLNKRLMQKRAR